MIVKEQWKLTSPRTPSHSILREKIRQETFEEVMKRIFSERARASGLLTMNTGSLLTKYSTSGRPAQRWFFVSEDGSEVMWVAPKKPHEPSPKKKDVEEAIQKEKKRFISLGSEIRSKWLADVRVMYYGPYHSWNFQRYVKKMDGASGYPWLAFSLEFPDRTLDVVCKDEEEVTIWFLGIQSLAPLNRLYLTRGALLWERLIMKLNFYGLRILQDGQSPFVKNNPSQQRSHAISAPTTVSQTSP